MATLLSSQILFRFNLLSGLRRRLYRQRSVVKISWTINIHRVYHLLDGRLGECLISLNWIMTLNRRKAFLKTQLDQYEND